MTNETHRHHFQVADVGAWDLDEDRASYRVSIRC